MPGSEDRQLIQQQWQDERYPRENSISLGAGFYCLFELPHEHPQLINKQWMPASDYCASQDCEGLAALAQCVASTGPWQASAGECSAHGADGFLSLQEKDSGTLIWLVVLKDSNPFNRVEIQHRHLLAESTSGITVRVPLERPDQLTLVWP
ncbi:hypothetical protein [Pseudomonas protegens]|uniref:hypothetical protein n=1 Tax=Pseudomonas protegens TaxID=380021 RepID=UPI001E4E4175|nr:hypothetical protein [Pseudomonas protegens]MCD9571939.1 hypothetical protein [Pseudomonas protegens]